MRLLHTLTRFPRPRRSLGAQRSAEPPQPSELTRRAHSLSERAQRAANTANLPSLRQELRHLEDQAAHPSLWDDPPSAQQLMQRVDSTRKRISELDHLQSLADEAVAAAELTHESEELASEAERNCNALESELEALEARQMLNGPYDDCNAFLTITAGAGGVDAQDWAMMLERMYLRWATHQGLEIEKVERSDGEEAGLKTSLHLLKGSCAFGMLNAESGTHRLVRQSPFNAKGLRQTSFAGVEAFPELDEATRLQVNLNESDCEITAARASGAGGQHVNTTNSAVRIKHLPTGISVRCEQERSQGVNKERAFEMLRGKLAALKQQELEREKAELRGEGVKAEWGQQIRNYVLHPYQLIKDTRTGVERTDVERVLDGDLSGFVWAYLRHQASN